MASGRQLIDQLSQSIRRQIRAGKTVHQILKSTEIKRLQSAYSQTGFILNDHKLKQMIQRQLTHSPKHSPKRSPKRSFKRNKIHKKRSRSSKRSSKH